MPRRPPKASQNAIARRFDDVTRRLDRSEQPQAINMGQRIAKLTQLVTDLPAAITAALAVSATIGHLIVTGAADIAGLLTASGGVVSPPGVNSIGAYNNLLTSGYRGLWVQSPSGDFGYVPSSRRFKQDETPAQLDPALVLRLQLVTFRYIAAVDEFGESAALEWGLIAEEVDALGLTWLVDYDEEGLPLGLKLERVALALLPVLQSQNERLEAVEGRLAALEGRL